MSAGTYNFSIEQGATLTINLLWEDEGETPIDITGFTAKMQVRKRACDDSVVLEYSTANGKIALGGSAGTITITDTAANTKDYPIGMFVYDLEMTDGPTITRLIQGKVSISPEVTR
jgi:hypothetical protein